MTLDHPARRRGFQTLCRAALAILLVLTALVEAAPATLQAAPSRPTLRVKAPAQVDVGAPFSLTLRAHDISDIAGYETAVLFASDAVRFVGARQRENDLAKLGRGVQPLMAVDLPGYIVIGAYSCSFAECVTGKGKRRDRGGSGNVRLTELLFVADRPGVVELKLDATKFVDAGGNPVDVRSRTQSVLVHVGPPEEQTLYAASASKWTLSAAPTGVLGPLDLTGDGQVSIVDASEVALEWQMSRINAAPCGATIDKSRDVNQDGCIDVADAQLIATTITPELAAAAAPAGNAALDGQAAETDAATTEAAADTLAPQAASGMTFTVNSDGDETDSNIGNGRCEISNNSGICTLRAAIQEANARSGHDRIEFNISGSGPFTIQLSEGRPLPSLSDSAGATVDGYTQPGAAPNTDPHISNAVIKIQLRGIGAGGSNPLDGIRITGANNTVRGLAIFQFRRPIWIYGSAATDNVIIGSYIGIDASGGNVIPQLELIAHGIHVETGASRVRIGGTANGDRNVISGNGRQGVGIWHEQSDYNEIYNNIVGLTPDGRGRAPNQKIGLDMNYGSSDNIVGGSAAGQRNLVSGNNESGIEISHVGYNAYTTKNVVRGNYIGVDALGGNTMTPASITQNGSYGIFMEDGALENTITENVIGNNFHGGIGLDNYPNSPVRGMLITNNWIGVTKSGQPAPNRNHGLQIDGYQTQVGPGNIIAFNQGPGLRIEELDADFNKITQNSFYSNTGLGIDLAPTSGTGMVNQNDPDDADTGANDQLNFPVIGRASNLIISGTACLTCTVELFIADKNANGHGEGKTFVASTTANPADGSWAFSNPSVPIGSFVTTTATDAAGNTSEFSLNAEVLFHNDPPTASVGGPYSTNEGGSVQVSGSGSDPDGDSLSYSWDLDDNGTFETSGQTVTFSAANVDGQQTRTITMRAADPHGASTTAQATVDVANVAPSASNLTNNGPIAEGGTATITFVSPTDPAPADRNAGLRFAVACNGGSLAGATYASAGTVAAQSCTLDNGPASQLVRGRVFDKDGGYAEYTTTVQVNNVNPTASISGAPSGGPPDEQINMSSLVTDPSAADTQAGFSYNWRVTRGGTTFATGSSSSFSFVPDLPATYLVTLTATDQNGGQGTDTASIVIADNSNLPPSVAANGPYSVAEGGSVTVAATGSDPNNDPLTYSWDLDNNGTFETSGRSVSFSAAGIDGPGSRTIVVQTVDRDGLSATDNATVAISNANPTAGFNPPSSVSESASFTLSLTSATDPGQADRSAGLRYAFACDGGSLASATYGSSATSASVSCGAGDGPSTVTVRARVFDKDGGYTEYQDTITINNVNPTATVSNNGPIDEGGTALISVSNQADPGQDDQAAGLRYAFACDGGSLGGATYGNSSTNPTKSCTFSAGPGSRTVRVRIIDKDGGYTEYTTTVAVSNVAPTAQFDVPANVVAGSSFTIALTKPFDPSGSGSSGLTYAFSCSGGSLGSFGSTTSATCSTSGSGTRTVRAAIRDSDGAQTDYYAQVTINENQLDNSGFEADSNGDGEPDGWSSKSYFTRSNALARSGNYAGRHSATNNTGYTINSPTIGGLKAGIKYTAGMWVNIPSTSDSFTFKVQVRWMKGSTTIRTATVKTLSSSTSGWTLASASLTAPKDTTAAQVVMNVSSLNATIYVDDAAFYVGNQLSNPSFEASNVSGQPDLWSQNSRFTRSSTLVREDNYAGRHAGDDNASYVINQLIKSVNPGERYNVSGWVNIPANTDGDGFSVKVRVRWRNASGSTIGTLEPLLTAGGGNGFSSTTSGWEQLSASLVAPSGAASARVEIVITNLGTTSYNDDFYFGPES